MSKPWPLVRLGQVLTKSNESVDLKSDETYREVTIKLWGKGVILRRQATGAEMAANSPTTDSGDRPDQGRFSPQGFRLNEQKAQLNGHPREPATRSISTPKSRPSRSTG